jgi:tRNA-specific 2-thiouridylase
VRRERIVVAMSGGVDSSTAAALLHAEGHDVVGVTLKLTDATGTAASIGGRCCGPRDIEDARMTAGALGFPHYVLDETAAFREAVIDEFVSEHARGRTPNPCVRCNEKLKFGPLIRFARAVGAARLATGHYARLDRGEGGAVRLRRALDAQKDQSYFLFGVSPELFEHVLFPLGDRTKEEVRAIARRFHLANADKPDSQQICFVPEGDHLAFVERRGGAGPAGAIVDEQGQTVGRHPGTHRFTVGQRRGVPVAAGGEKRFVVRIDAASGQVVVGPREATGLAALQVTDVRWTGGGPPRAWPVRCAVQLRHRAAALPGWLTAASAPSGAAAGARPSEPAPSSQSPSPGGAAVEGPVVVCGVVLDAPAFGVAPGQAAVFYDADRVMGGGWIASGP